MSAPTPISALVHSSTLVTAGIYIFIRFSPYFRYFLILPIVIVSLLTSFLAGVSAIIELDFKKIIALSTLSQLGIILSILFVGNFFLSFFHLIIHAFFKSLLFLSAGLVIHNNLGSQDIRILGGNS